MLDALAWPLERAGEALTALAVQSGLQPSLRELGAPGPAVLADPDDAAIERWLAGAAAGLGLEAEAVDSDIAGIDDLLRAAAPAVLRVGEGGRGLLLLLRGGRRHLVLVAPDLRPRRVATAEVRRLVCEPVLAPCAAAPRPWSIARASHRGRGASGPSSCCCASASASCGSGGPSSCGPRQPPRCSACCAPRASCVAPPRSPACTPPSSC
ncbi:hypothetical protein [Nannocystis pusilla]|uniref:hypothetical protein n=1 Tax=Nannocystis pusilla TaxID=889268 RepID=UPI003B7C1299